jgi:hypothetical protein
MNSEGQLLENQTHNVDTHEPRLAGVLQVAIDGSSLAHQLPCS